MTSPFAHYAFDPSIFSPPSRTEEDIKKDQIKIYFRKHIYMPHILQRSIDNNGRKRKDSSMIMSTTAGILFGEKRRVRFQNLPTRFFYEAVRGNE